MAHVAVGAVATVLGHLTYLVFEVVWGLPIVLGQWALAWRHLWPRRGTLLAALALATVYLSCADAVAIANGIWTLHRDRIIGVYVGIVPVEEIVFFLLTNAMVVQSVVLFSELLRRRSAGTSLVDSITRS